MNGSRFQLAYGIGENLTPEEINKLDLKDKEVKIKDDTGELPDLIVSDHEVARKYINYMNRPEDEMKITKLTLDIKSSLERLNGLNQSLIQPKKIIVGEDAEGEPVYDTPIKEELYYVGYITRVNNITKHIHTRLNQLKNTLTEK